MFVQFLSILFCFEVIHKLFSSLAFTVCFDINFYPVLFEVNYVMYALKHIGVKAQLNPYFPVRACARK